MAQSTKQSSKSRTKSSASRNGSPAKSSELAGEHDHEALAAGEFDRQSRQVHEGDTRIAIAARRTEPEEPEER